MIELISHITILPKVGVDLLQYFRGKGNGKKLAVMLRNKYGVVKDKREYVIDTINNHEIRIAAKLLTVKIVWKNHMNHCTSGVTASTEKCTAGVQMNCSIFLLNELMEDIVLAE